VLLVSERVSDVSPRRVVGQHIAKEGALTVCFRGGSFLGGG
jgi:hypothetical protein